METKETLGIMSAKARGEHCHNGPLELRKSLPGRDCTAWVREDKQYNPYSYFESADNKPLPKLKKPAAPPALWLPPRARDPKSKKNRGLADSLRLGAEAGEDEAGKAAQGGAKGPGAGLEERRPWDTEHHVMHSRMNHEVQVGMREYFGKPMVKEGEGVPKVREQYAMNDRQCCWNDEPAPAGESRRTVYGNIGPYNRGGCKEQQMPSYWRKVQDWQSFSTPDLTCSISGKGRPLEKPPAGKLDDKKALLLALADTPAEVTKEFWRRWACERSAPGSLPPPSQLDAPRGWDGRWNVCSSRANDLMNQRQREYFSVPAGFTGVHTEAPRKQKSARALLRAAEVSDRFAE